MPVWINGGETAQAVYDDLADRYDSTFTNRLFRAEDRAVMAWLGKLDGTVLDIGCGTGLYLDYRGGRTFPTEYIGVDISPRMIERARAKHPAYEWRVGDMGNADDMFLACPDGWADHVICLFGSISYCLRPTDALGQMYRCLRPGGQVHLMALGLRYPSRPTHISDGRCPFLAYSPLDLRKLFLHWREVQIRGLTGRTEHLLPDLPQLLYDFALQAESRTILTAWPEQGYFQLLTARKPG